MAKLTNPGPSPGEEQSAKKGTRAMYAASKWCMLKPWLEHV